MSETAWLAVFSCSIFSFSVGLWVSDLRNHIQMERELASIRRAMEG